jgi:hypothetical protein
LNGPRPSDLTGTRIDGQYFPSWTNLLGKVEGRNAVAGCDVEDSQPRAKVEVLK